ncbi:hypothetical protein IW140_005202 [Coemansia sp. RSA 1813]|nr:hypothetical protein IW140_005202 [Coemansia sp. RSA 1813]
MQNDDTNAGKGDSKATEHKETANSGYNTAESLSAHKQVAIRSINNYLLPNINGLLDLAIPDEEKTKEIAGKLAADISTLIENLLSVSDSSNSSRSQGMARCRGSSYGNFKPGKQRGSSPDSNEAAELVSNWISEQQQFSSAKSKPVKVPSWNNAVVLNKRFDEFKKWVNFDNDTSKEDDLYGPISQFFYFVAGCIKSSHELQSVRPKRLILPFSHPCRKGANGDGNSRSGLFLNLTPVDDFTISTKDENKLPILSDILALAEVTSSKHGICNALPQLFQYTSVIYAGQHNRRFIWGLAVEGTQVQVVFFGPNYALASPTINIDQKEGRMQLVKLLASWSFCASHQLGYDPTITYNNELKCYEIRADHEVAPITYYSRGSVIEPERLFGRRTRCFLASATKPTAGVEFEQDIFIKDAWPEAAGHIDDDYRDESRYLKTIAKILDEVHGLDGKCPKYQSGGRVDIKRWVSGGGSETIEDTSRSILTSYICKQLNNLPENKKAPSLRVHKRICVKGIGMPLKFVDNVFELICVVADAMECHWEIYQRCGIFHRDISTNNFLFSGSGSSIKGMLIDFDHSISKDDKDAVRNFKQSGTFPFMSVNNLEGSVTDYSVLDDWESFIYVLCWIGVYGWRKVVDIANRPNGLKDNQHAQPTMKLISRWEGPTFSECARSKRIDLYSEDLFFRMTEEFDKETPSIRTLKRLVCKLRRTLIDEHQDEKIQGSLKKPLRSERIGDSVYVVNDHEPDPELFDPFEERAKEADEIAKRLLKTLQEAASQARTYLKHQEQNSDNTNV